MSQFRFYGPATGCNDLGRLGYTLNGFYLVQEKENHSTNSISSNNRQIEIVECNFKHNPKLGKESKYLKTKLCDKNKHIFYLFYSIAPGDKEKRLGVIRTSNSKSLFYFLILENKIIFQLIFLL